MKKIISFILILVLVLNICLYSYYNARAYDNSDDLLDAITSVIDTYSDDNLVASEVTDIYNKDNRVVGASVTIENDKGESYGYINFDFKKESPLSDFMIYEDTEDLFEEIAGDEMGRGDKIYKVDSFSYVAKDGNKYINENDDIMSKKEFKKEYDDVYAKEVSGASKYRNFESIILEISGANFKSSKKIKQYNSSKSCLSKYTFIKQINRYACAVHALTEIAYQDGVIKDTELTGTYNYLWNKTETSGEKKDGVTYGSTQNNKLKVGYSSLLKYKNKSGIITEKNSPGFNFF